MQTNDGIKLLEAVNYKDFDRVQNLLNDEMIDRDKWVGDAFYYCVKNDDDESMKILHLLTCNLEGDGYLDAFEDILDVSGGRDNQKHLNIFLSNDKVKKWILKKIETKNGREQFFRFPYYLSAGSNRGLNQIKALADHLYDLAEKTGGVKSKILREKCDAILGISVRNENDDSFEALYEYYKDRASVKKVAIIECMVDYSNEKEKMEKRLMLLMDNANIETLNDIYYEIEDEKTNPMLKTAYQDEHVEITKSYLKQRDIYNIFMDKYTPLKINDDKCFLTEKLKNKDKKTGRKLKI